MCRSEAPRWTSVVSRSCIVAGISYSLSTLTVGIRSSQRRNEMGSPVCFTTDRPLLSSCHFLAPEWFSSPGGTCRDRIAIESDQEWQRLVSLAHTAHRRIAENATGQNSG